MYVLDVFPGATLNPTEWTRVLKGQGRRVHSFLFWAEWDVLEQRILADNKRSLSLEWQRTLHSMYGRPDFSEHFAHHAEIEEDRIAVADRPPGEIELAIVQRLSVGL